MYKKIAAIVCVMSALILSASSVSADNSAGRFTNRKSNAVNETVVQPAATANLEFTQNTVGEGADENKKFVYKLILSKDGEPLNGTQIYPFDGTASGSAAFVNGAIAFQMKNGQSIRFKDLPTGLAYEVTPTNNNGYELTKSTPDTVISENLSVTMTQKHISQGAGTEKKGETVALAFTQKIQGEASDPTKRFQYIISLTKDDKPIDGIFEFDGTASGSAAFSDGMASFQMKSGQSIRFMGLPKGTVCYITSVMRDAKYRFSCDTNGITLFEDKTITLIQSTGEEQKAVITERKAQNTIIRSNTYTVKERKLKKKNLKIAPSKVFTVKNAKGKVTYQKVSGSKRLSISKTGRITVRKKTKKGTYKMKVKFVAAGNETYKPDKKVFNIRIKVR